MTNDKVLLEFTLNGHKHTYFRRYSIFGNVVTTTNKNNAREVKERQVPIIIKHLLKEHGPHSVRDIRPFKKGEEGKQ